MVIVKKQGAEFFDGFCPICHCEFVYQLEDVLKDEMVNTKDMDFDSMGIFQKMFGEMFEKPYVTCPHCKTKVLHSPIKR